MRLLVIPVLAAACGYRAGSFVWGTNRFAGEPSTVGCLDIAVSRAADSDVGPVIAFDFGNRCSRPSVVDFEHARVEGVTADGRRVALAPYDPDGDIAEREIDAVFAGHEVIAYASAGPVVFVCIDLASIAHAPGESWRCVQRPEVAP